MTIAWFEDPKQLFNEKKLLSFWPTSKQDVGERVNATTRFIVYISVVLYIIQKDPRILFLSLMCVGVLWCFYKSDMIENPTMRPAQTDGRKQSPMRPVCEGPTAENPMANVLLSDYTEYPDRPGACFYPNVANKVHKLLDDSFPQDVNNLYGKRNMAVNRMYSMPATTIPNDQTGFAEAAYGKKFRPMCRDDSAYCNPDFWGVQPEAFAGLDPAGDKRGIRGGTPAGSS